MSVSLVFPPGWTSVTGSPHAALPMLAGYLRAKGVECEVADLNHVPDEEPEAPAILDTVVTAAWKAGIEESNRIYFEAQYRRSLEADAFDAEWPLLLGFAYRGYPERSSRSAHESLGLNSPYTQVLERYVQHVSKRQFDVLGFSVAADRQLVFTLQLCSMLRASGYRGRIVLGGNTISRLSNELAATTWLWDLADALIVFQGEEALLAFCQEHKQRDHWRSIPGLIWRNEAGEGITNPHRINKIGNLVPCPDFSGLDVGGYWGVNYLCLVGSRGCYYGKCDFCPIPYGWGPNGFAGDRTAEKVFGDMLLLYEKHGIPRFKFTDEALSPVFMNNLAALIRRADAPFEWEGYTRFEKAWLDPKFVQHVADGGFRKGYFGLEVLPSDNRSVLNKGDSADPKVLLENCGATGVKAHLFCMFGYPGTGIDDAKRTTEFLLQNKGKIDTADIFGWGYAKHTKATGVEIIPDPEKDWALEYRYRPTVEGVLGPEEVQILSAGFEDLLWDEAPQFLHPVYRLVSPWRSHDICPPAEAALQQTELSPA